MQVHLLLIEDDLDLGAEVQRALVGYGLTSEWVRSAASAQALLGDDDVSRFACILLDLGLPDGDGLKMLERWRGQCVKVPVIVMTARDALEMRVAGLDAGADDYVVKPVETQELASRIRAVTRRAGGHASGLWAIGPVRIDTARREVTLAGAHVALSPKEFAVITELARHAGEVVAKHRLAQAVAPLGEPLDFGALEWHIANLRRKLGDDRIRTVRGVGYSIGE
jgi:two-component system, OmpR family, response regulator QseB